MNTLIEGGSCDNWHVEYWHKVWDFCEGRLQGFRLALWRTMGALLAHHGRTMGALWVHCGRTLGAPWVHRGCNMGVPWAHSGRTMGAPWSQHALTKAHHSALTGILFWKIFWIASTPFHYLLWYQSFTTFFLKSAIKGKQKSSASKGRQNKRTSFVVARFKNVTLS